MEKLSDSLITICIPNFNYGSYLDLTLESLSNQIDKDFEVVISDNRSTDNSMEVIKKWAPSFAEYKFSQNKTNVGFGGNLDKTAKMARNQFMIMLSSDDVVNPEAISVYKKFINLVQNKYPSEKFFFGGQPDMIDADGNFLNKLTKGDKLWYETDIDESLTHKMGFKVYKVSSNEMLRRCLLNFKTPLHFITVCYPKISYEEVEGYGGARMYNPDKWFNWKLLEVTDNIYYLDTQIFQYRWHNNNQANQQQQNQILKYWMDEYRNCFETTNDMLKKCNISRNSLQQAFISRSIIPYALRHLGEGNFLLSKRIFNLGKACYPANMRQNKYYLALHLALSNRVTYHITRNFVKCFITKG